MRGRKLGKVRGASALLHAEDYKREYIDLNNRGDLIVAEGLPSKTEIVRLGDSWQVQLTTALAPVTAYPPTTLAGLSLYNGEPAMNGKCYIIEAFGSVSTVGDKSSTALCACNTVTPLSIAIPAATVGLTVRGMLGNAYGGKARPVSGLTITNDGWFAHGNQSPLSTADLDSTFKVNEVAVEGLYIVQPGGMFNVQAVQRLATALQIFFIRWHEAMLIYRT